MRFCPKCGARLKLASWSRTCPNCGAPLGEAAKEEPPAAPVGTLIESFPFKGMRPHQGEVLEKIGSSIDAGKKFIILEAPVGFGKSAVAAALCRHFRSAYIMTSTKQLQEQYSADFGFTTVMGKSNFTCQVPTSFGRHVDCARGRCMADWSLADCQHYLTFAQYEMHLKRQCNKTSKCEALKRSGGSMCPYYKQKWDSFRKDVTVGNYPFFFSELRFTDEIRRRRLLVCDEAHDLEKQLVGYSAYTLRASSVRQYQGPDAEFAIRYEAGMESDPGSWVGVIEETRQILQAFFDAHSGTMTMQDKLTACRGMLESLKNFVDELKASPGNWIVSGLSKAQAVDGAVVVEEVHFQPLEVAAITSKLFDTADTVLLMSATIFSAELLCKTLGISQEDAAFVKVAESSFPVENRRIYSMDIAKLNRASMDASMEGIAKAVDAIMDRHSGEKGVIHTTNYLQTNYILGHVSEHNRARLVTTEGSKNRSELLRVHGTRDASVLISPSLHQGVDLKDDLSRFQIIMKVPYPDLSDRRTQVKMQRDEGWYDWQTALRLVQTYGRSVRSETDHAVTYILDSNFPSFVRNHRDLFPAYFLEALSER
jgi:ATP-dependent DNA helicase DinG